MVEYSCHSTFNVVAIGDISETDINTLDQGVNVAGHGGESTNVGNGRLE